jgi:5-methylcytosine-specific restriction endonuclease McrA
VKVSRSRQNDAITCSPACLAELRRQNIIRHHHSEDTRLAVCAFCGAPITRKPSQIGKYTDNYCDSTCKAKHQQRPNPSRSGAACPAYTHGQACLGSGWVGARRLARDRDEHRCQICGITATEYGRALSVHHLVPISEFADKSEAHTLDNLVTLCQPCHVRVHHANEPPTVGC